MGGPNAPLGVEDSAPDIADAITSQAGWTDIGFSTTGVASFGGDWQPQRRRRHRDSLDRVNTPPGAPFRSHYCSHLHWTAASRLDVGPLSTSGVPQTPAARRSWGDFNLRRQRSGRRQCAKERPFRDGLANGSNRPFAALQDRPCERAGSARKRSSAEGAGCANPGRSNTSSEPLNSHATLWPLWRTGNSVRRAALSMPLNFAGGQFGRDIECLRRFRRDIGFDADTLPIRL